MGDRKSNEDQVQQISTSIYVMNFPEHFSSRDLWKKCQEYGGVIDAYISNRRSKSGDRFGFVRFSHIKDVDRLVKNLCALWTGRLRLHANVARFQRPPLNKAQYVKGTNVGYKPSVGVPSNSRGFFVGQSSYAGAVKNNGEYKQVVEVDSNPSLVLDESCILEYDYSLALKGKISDFGLLTNLKTVLIKEGFDNFNLKYFGGFWILIEFRTKESLENFKSHVGVGSWKFSSISRSHGFYLFGFVTHLKGPDSNTWFSSLEYASNNLVIDERVVWVDIEGNTSLYSKGICIKTKMEQNIFETFKIIVKGKIYWIRAKEVSGWIPDFLEEDDEEDESDDDRYIR
ncbi:nucleotide-binding alpha-beta plait domain-containing protein [Tanacetum coccineum]